MFIGIGFVVDILITVKQGPLITAVINMIKKNTVRFDDVGN